MTAAATSEPSNTLGSSGCPWHMPSEEPTQLAPDDELILPNHKRVVATYTDNPLGTRELHVYYGEKEIVFDDPAYFEFGDALAKQSRFVAATSVTWGTGYDWHCVRTLLEQLLDEGILQRADTRPASTDPSSSSCPIAHLPTYASVPRTWLECEAITGELIGHAIELGYLELIVPIYRVAHPAMDDEGRQIGEANVFPQQLCLDLPTEWRTCQHPGSRYQDERPMNVTALRSMIKHWKQTLMALLRIRDAYLQRFPRARQGWTVGDLQRLTSLVLTLPAYLLMRADNRVDNGTLHPVFSSMFRVTDGVRMTMHRMLFTSDNEPTRPPETPITSADVYAYAERNTVFLSDHGVCAGPKAMIEEFLHVLIDGKPVNDSESVILDATVQFALDDLEPAFDYGLYGLQAYAVGFSLWPEMGRTYERIQALIESWSANEPTMLHAFRERLRRSIDYLHHSSRLRTEALRATHEHAYADMYAHCATALNVPAMEVSLSGRIVPLQAAHHEEAVTCLHAAFQNRFQGVDNSALMSLVQILVNYFRQEQAIVRAASAIQQRINGLLGRKSPSRPLTAADLATHYRLVALDYDPEELREIGNRLPYLVDDLEEALGLRVIVSSDAIEISDRTRK
jgi:hypothetical protein